MKLVSQEDKNGCCIACAAMVTGMSYQYMKDFYLSLKPNQDFELHGICWTDICELLNHHHYTYQLYYKARLGLPNSRPIWPLEPFAPVHILSLNFGTRTHAVVMDKNHVIYDPQFGIQSPDYYKEYHNTNWMLGVYPPIQT